MKKKFIWSALSVGMIALFATMAPDIKRYIRISTM
jgi:purine-cytosine permease-like protein